MMNRATAWWCGAIVAMGAGGLAFADTPDPTAGDAAVQGGDETAAPTPFRLSAYWENDGAYVKPNHNTDRHYTNGVGLSLALQPDWADDLADGLGLEHDGTAAGLMFGHEIYTPDDLLIDPPDPEDRPYAGYLFFGGFWQRQHGHHLDHVQLDLGVVGPSARGEQIQSGVHNTFDGDDPQGWNSQLTDEFAAQATYRRRYRYDLPGFDPAQTDWAHQLLPYAELNLGTVHRNAEAGATYRLGVRLPDDFGPDQLHDVGSFTAPQTRFDPTTNTFVPAAPRGWSAYGFARVAVRYVEWNTFLEGSYGDNPSPSVSAQPWVGEGQAGFAIGYQGETHRFELVYSQTYLTDEFEEQDDDNGFGAVTLRWSAAF